MLVSNFGNCEAILFHLHACFGVLVAALAIILLIHRYGKLEFSLVILKQRMLRIH